MAYIFRHLICYLVFAVGGVECACAQEALTPVRVKAKSLTFSVFARHRPAARLQFFPVAGGPARTVEFFGNTRSPRYTTEAGATVLFYDVTALKWHDEARARDPQNPPSLPAPAAVAEVPAGIERALFLFIPVRPRVAGEPRLRVYVVDDSPKRLPAGYAAVINASGREYVAQIGEERIEVPHGIGGIVPVQGSVELRLAAQTSDGWMVGGRHTFRLGAHDRASLVLFPPTSPTGIAPIIRTLIEDVPAEEGGVEEGAASVALGSR